VSLPNPKILPESGCSWFPTRRLDLARRQPAGRGSQTGRLLDPPSPGRPTREGHDPAPVLDRARAFRLTGAGEVTWTCGGEVAGEAWRPASGVRFRASVRMCKWVVMLRGAMDPRTPPDPATTLRGRLRLVRSHPVMRRFRGGTTCAPCGRTNGHRCVRQEVQGRGLAAGSSRETTRSVPLPCPRLPRRVAGQTSDQAPRLTRRKGSHRVSFSVPIGRTHEA
jgi:hypothetical protein